MKRYLFPCLFVLMFPCLIQAQTFVGSTPAHLTIREFLHLSTTDSIDFIRWKLEIGGGKYNLHCSYGLAKAGTPGFSNEQSVAFSGKLTTRQHYYLLEQEGRSISIQEVNKNVLHFLDQNNHMLIGNGGYSYALNNTNPVASHAVNIQTDQTVDKGPLVYEGRTPCSELPQILGLKKSEACNKMKWYFLLYTDSITNKPSYFLMAGIGYRKETMAKGNWQMVTDQNGNISYQLYFNKWAHPLTLLKGDDNILFFTDNHGRLLVGNEDFSYTLNRRTTEYPRREN
jgi:hypothetical protein